MSGTPQGTVSHTPVPALLPLRPSNWSRPPTAMQPYVTSVLKRSQGLLSTCGSWVPGPPYRILHRGSYCRMLSFKHSSLDHLHQRQLGRLTGEPQDWDYCYPPPPPVEGLGGDGHRPESSAPPSFNACQIYATLSQMDMVFCSQEVLECIMWKVN